MHHADTRVVGLLHQQVMAARGRRQDLADPVGGDLDRFLLGDHRKALATPSCDVGGDLRRIRELDPRLGKDPPAARTSVSEVELLG